MLCILFACLALYFLHLSFEYCCNTNNNSSETDIELATSNQNEQKIRGNQVNFLMTSETQMNKQNVEANVSDQFKAEGLFEYEENEFLDPTLIDDSYEKIATCSHLSIFMKFNDENLHGAIVLNKMTNNAFEVKGDQINDYLQK